MIVGLLRVVLVVPHSRSLKDRRQVVRGLVDRLRARHGVSVSEVEPGDSWQRAVIGVATVGPGSEPIHGVLDACLRTIESAAAGVQVVDVQRSVAPFAEGEPAWHPGDDEADGDDHTEGDAD